MTDTSAFVSTGAVLLVFVAAAVLTLPASFGLLWLYGNAVARAMRRRAGTEPPGAPAPAWNGALASGAHGSAPTLLTPDPVGGPGLLTAPGGITLDVVDQTAPVGHALDRHAARLTWIGPWQVAGVYAAAGLAQSVVLALLSLELGELLSSWPRVLILSMAYWWPVTLTTSLTTAGARQVRLVLLYVGAFVLANAVLSLSPPLEGAWQGVMLLVIVNGLPTLFLLALLHPRFRAVAPLVFVFMLAGAAGAQAGLGLVASEAGMNAFVTVVVAAHLDVTLGLVLVALLGFALVCGVGWIGLRLLGRAYQRKAISDQSLLVDSIWLIFCLNVALDAATSSDAWPLLLLGFVAYKLVCWAGFHWLRARFGRAPNHRLLLLRVFGSRRRSERLMATVGARWRYAGSIQLIGAADLAAADLQPHEFLDFVRGRLANRYIDSPERLARQSADLDLRRDADGRFRINEFLCYDDTWRATLAQLVASNDSVLMDLREFSPANQGCVYELRQLVDVAPLEKVVLVVDSSTDLAFLREVLEAAWTEASAASPNRRSGTARVRAFVLERDSERSIKAVLAGLAEAATATPSPVAVAVPVEVG